MGLPDSGDKLLRERKQVRRVFTRTANKEILTKVDYDFLHEKATTLTTLDKLIHEMILSDSEFNEQDFEKEYDICEEYQEKWRLLNATRVKNEYEKPGVQLENRPLRLPKLEIRQFDDNPKNWLAFWSQFEKIHINSSIEEQDKLQYLLQAMAEGSQARGLVASYPSTKGNYDLVIQTLKGRYGRDEVLIEIYVRELLNLVLTKGTVTVDVLYDRVSVNLQILESLGISKGKYECMLVPLIESSLPDRLLIEWSKLPLSGEPKLTQLLEFMRKEVQAEERCKLARVALGSTESGIPTAACLTTNVVRKAEKAVIIPGKELCYFCDRPHNTLECGKINSISLEERKEAIKKKGGCYICLKKGHMARACKAFVKCMSCGKRHLVILCPDIEAQRKPVEPKGENKENPEVISNFSSNNKAILLQTVVVKVYGNKNEKNVRVLLDSGSQRTYVKAELTEQLGLKVTGSESLGHSLFGGVKKTAQAHRLVELRVSNLDNTYQTTMIALEQDVLCGTLPRVQDANLIKHLQKSNISLSDIKGGTDTSDIGILIGSDHLGSLLENNMVHISDNLLAMQTKLGWVLQGPVQGVSDRTINAHFVSTLPEDIEFMWNIETLGIKDPYDKEKLSETEILKNFNDSISVNKDGRYEVGLLWKDGPELESNYEQTYRRLLSTTKKLESMGKLTEYDEVFQEWQREGIIEMAQNNETNEGHYLPHHAVIKLESTTTKIRPVFDASCKDRNKNSLNACIEKGTNLIEVIPKLLTLFRAGTYGVTSDIRKAFLQIAVTEPDRKYLKLLWWKDLKGMKELVTYQHARVPFGVACSPFLLAATVNYHLEKHADTYPETARKLKESFYVDNSVTSFDTEKEVTRFREEATNLMIKGKFELREWTTNANPENRETVSVLGIQWNIIKDDLCCTANIKTVPKEITKRDLLSITQQIFDPIGFLSPTTLVPRLIIQKAWILKTGWDEKIPIELEREYKEWLSTIDYINQCRIPRRLAEASLLECKVALHVFCDASKEAYASCVFLRTEYGGQVTVRLIIAKNRVAPIKRQMTLPRLELMGALIASRQYREVMTSGLLAACKDNKVYCWTDSAVVLAWLKRQETWKAFVTNRVKEICMNTNKEVWNHLPGIYNPADLPSRGCSAKTLLETQWWTGPKWLYLDEKEWPRSCITRMENEEELIASEQSKSTTVNVEINTEDFSNRLLYFSTYSKIVRLMARLLRMSPRIRREYTITSLHIGYSEYKNAEKTLMKIIQKEYNTDMKKNNKKLITTEEDGILKVKTRLEYSEEDKSFIYPILLPGKSEIIKRLAQQTHLDMHHAGSLTMMTTLRNTYWITGIRRLTKKIVANCMNCKRYKVKHYEVPEPPLPKDRICNTVAFEVTGIDLAGPLILKNTQKCWIVLFTCAIYRAIHLELTDSVSTASFMMALRRFISRRGRPRIIYTDNGTNFVGTANLLKQVDWQQVEKSTITYNIQWKFSVPAAPWWGGWWERLVRVVKEMLRRILGRAAVDSIELSTILCDCEAVINSRPLTYVDMGDMRPLTPMMFLQGLSTNDTPDLDQIDHKNLNIRFKYLQQLREDFRKRFRSEYLGLLISKGKETKREPKVGEIVLIETDSKRLHWPIGIIKEIFTGKDNCNRAARIQTASGERVRPYQKLFPLEISASSQEWLTGLTGSSAVESGPEQHKPVSGKSNISQEPCESLPAYTTRSGRTIKTPFRFLE